MDLGLSYRGRSARRHVQARSCDDLVEATAVLLALAVTEAPDEGEPVEAAVVPAPAPPPPPIALSPVHEPRLREKRKSATLPPLGIQLDLGVVLESGRVGSWTGGGALGWYEDRGSLALSARYSPPVAVAHRLNVSSASVRVGTLELDLTGCLNAGLNVRLLGCGAISMSRYAVQTVGITIPAQVAAWSPGVALAGGLLFPLGPRAFAGLLADGRLRAPQAFVVRGVDQVAYRAPAFGASTRATLGVHW
jgi:hypothetical protein